jgi:hypothetical protein
MVKVLSGRHMQSLRPMKLRRAYFESLTDFIVDEDFQTYTVLCLNREASLREARKILGTFAKKVDEYCLGRRRLDSIRKRYRFIAFPEHIHSNIHWNINGTLPIGLRRMDVDSAEGVLRNLLNEFYKPGTLTHQNIYDAEGVARYSTKEKWQDGWEENFVVSTEFHPF